MTGEQDVCRLIVGQIDACGKIEDWNAAVDFAVYFNLGSLLYHAVRKAKLDLPSTVMERLHERYLASAADFTRKRLVLSRILAELAAAEIACIPLKGVYLAETFYQSPSLRPMADLDIMVKDEHLGDAVGILAGLGFAAEHAFDLETAKHYAKHLPDMAGPNGVKLDLHADLGATFPFSKTAGCRVETDEMWKRSRPIELAGCRCRELAIEDQLIFLAIHLAQHEYQQMLLRIVDLHQIISNRSVDWHLLRCRSEEMGAWRMVHTAVHLCRRLFGSDVPIEYHGFVGPRECEERLLRRVFARLQSPCSMHEPQAVVRFRALPLVDKLRYLHFTFFSSAAVCSQFGLNERSPFWRLWYVPRMISLLSRYTVRLGRSLINPPAGHCADIRSSADYQPVQEWLRVSMGEKTQERRFSL